jgi:FkbM family methyltransferase
MDCEILAFISIWEKPFGHNANQEEGTMIKSSIGLKDILRYIKQYGVLWTIAFILKVCFCNRKIAFRVRGYSHRFFARTDESDLRVFNQVVARGCYDIDFIDIEPRLIVDAGANVGYSTIVFAEKFPDSVIYAIEPDMSNYEILQKNVCGYENVSPINAALWFRNAKLNIVNPDAPKTAVFVREEDGPENIRAITITEILNEYGGVIDILKLDIEGAEKDLFEHNSNTWLDRVNVIIIELHDFVKAGCARAFYSAISSYPFRQDVVGENIVIHKPPENGIRSVIRKTAKARV